MPRSRAASTVTTRRRANCSSWRWTPAGETSAEVGEWLDSITFAKAKWSRQAKWTTYNVNSIIRRTIYRGFETNRVKVEKRKLRTGKSQPVWSDEDKIHTRASPHLRIVSDHLWYKAYEVVDKRRVIPYMRIDGKRVVPRLEFTINLVAALPSAVAGPLRQAATEEGEPPAGGQDLQGDRQGF